MDPNELVNKLVKAHYEAALNNKGNISSVAALNSYQGSGSFHQAIASGVLAMGGQHAPIEQCRQLIRRYIRHGEMHFEMYVLTEVSNNRKIPGYGHSFYKDQIDPAFQEAYNDYRECFEDKNPIDEIQRLIHKVYSDRDRPGIHLPPNAAIITAGICEVINAPMGAELQIALEGRVLAWVQLINQGGWKE